MKIITKITMQQKSGRYNIFLDEEFFCGVSEDTLIKLELKKGKQVDEESLQEIVKEEQKNKCFNEALYLLGRQNYFRKALYQKLKQKNYTQEEIEYTFEKLEQYHYIDDRKLTESFVKDKKRFSKKGPRLIAGTLKMKGVDEETIRESLNANYTEEEALENCMSLLDKKMEYYKRKTTDAYQLKGKLYAFLIQRGFNSETIIKAIEKSLNKEDE